MTKPDVLTKQWKYLRTVSISLGAVSLGAACLSQIAFPSLGIWLGFCSGASGIIAMVTGALGTGVWFNYLETMRTN